MERCVAVEKRGTGSAALGKGLLFTGETLHIYLLMFRSVPFIYNEEVRSTNEVVMVSGAEATETRNIFCKG